MLEQLQHLENLELSLVEDSEAAARRGNMRLIAFQRQGAAVTHTLRRVYVDVGGDHDFELLRELLKFCLNVHLVRGTFSNALLECRRFHDELVQPEVFTFTSELPASVPFPYKPDLSSTFTDGATICANVRRKR
ncbi:hypothetical protein MTO96_038188 [Rhipicephalus appendiculatus]